MRIETPPTHRELFRLAPRPHVEIIDGDDDTDTDPSYIPPKPDKGYEQPGLHTPPPTNEFDDEANERWRRERNVDGGDDTWPRGSEDVDLGYVNEN